MVFSWCEEHVLVSAALPGRSADAVQCTVHEQISTFSLLFFPLNLFYILQSDRVHIFCLPLDPDLQDQIQTRIPC